MCVCACMRVCVRPCVCHNSTIARYTLQVAAKLPAVVRRAGGAATTHRQTDLMIQSSVSCMCICNSFSTLHDYTLHGVLSDNQSVPKICLSLCSFGGHCNRQGTYVRCGILNVHVDTRVTLT